MLNAPITGDKALDSFLFDVQNEITSPTGIAANTNTGAIYDTSTGVVVSYLYKYIHVRYADDNIGTNISTSETNKLYFGIQNTDSPTAATEPAAYTWYLTVGFGTINHLYSIVSGGRQIRWYVGSSQPIGYIVVPTTPTDLDTITGTGIAGLSSIIAYKIQGQSVAAPTFTTSTVGSAVPSGWSLTAGTVSVGQVIWYIFGRYNSSTATVDGVLANTTAWTGPTAASVFQDIRSDNWNGSNPPTFSKPATWGTAGYYIKRDDGTAILNNIGARGTLQTGTAAVSGSTMTGSGGVVNSDGTFALGNPTNNISFNGSTLTVNGPVVTTANIAIGAVSTTTIATLPTGLVGYLSSYTSVGSLDLSGYGTNPCIVMFSANAALYWDDSSSNVYSGCMSDVGFKAQQGSGTTMVTVTVSTPTGGTYAPGFANLSCSLYVADPSAGVIDLAVATNLRGNPPGGGSISTYLKTNFLTGGLATILCLKR